MLSYVAQLPCLNIENVEHAYILDICWLGGLSCVWIYVGATIERNMGKSSVKMEVLTANASRKNDDAMLKYFVFEI